MKTEILIDDIQDLIKEQSNASEKVNEIELATSNVILKKWMARQKERLRRLKNDLVIEVKNMGIVPDTSPELKCEIDKMLIDIKLGSLSDSKRRVISEIIDVLKPLLDVYNSKLSSSATYSKRISNKLKLHRYYIEKELRSYLKLNHQLASTY